jgi:hypothetical protein
MEGMFVVSVERVGAWFWEGTGMDSCDGDGMYDVWVVVRCSVMLGWGGGGFDEDVPVAVGGIGLAPGCGGGGTS